MKFENLPFMVASRPFVLACLVGGQACLLTQTAWAEDYYVATTGSDSNSGSEESPFGTLQKGIDTAGPGDTVFVHGGTYEPTRGLTFSKSGTSENRIKYWAVPGEKPVFDFARTTGGWSAFLLTGSWLHVKGFEIRNPSSTVPMNAVNINDCSNNIVEELDIHHFEGTGIFISHGSGGHLLLNCDAHDNYDPQSAQGDGQNADGFGVHYQAAGDGTPTTIRGCRAWWNSDDGYDFINQEVPVTIEDSWAFGNGWADFGTHRPADGNGNGFKIGSSKTGIRHLVQNNVAWGNRASGFYANHSSGGNTWYNNTSFQNGTEFNMLASTWSEPNGKGTRTDGVILTGAAVHIMRNNVAFPNKNSYIEGYGVDSQFNSWDLGINPRAEDFASITDASLEETGHALEATSLALGPRQADGSVPDVDFLRLIAGSALIDQGTDVGLPFTGAAPDLGAFEWGDSGVSGSGGAVGSAGAPATAGASGSGGEPGSGGALATGGATDSGGTIGSTGGVVGSGGIGVGTGGTMAGIGGTPAGTGGGTPVGTGGIASTGGAGGLGGTANTGGAVALGGSVTVGGTATGGASVLTPAGDAAAIGGDGAPHGSSSDTGCSCRLAETRSTSHPSLAGLAPLLIALGARKRRRALESSRPGK